jgi:asparagine synthase (glutamine-hydrolysing)
MCGISALFAPRSMRLDDLARKMTAVVRHRGPDGEGFALFSADGFRVTPFGGEDTPPSIYEAGMAYAPKRGTYAGADSVVALGHRRLAIIDLSPAAHQPMSTADGRLWIVYNGEIYNYVELRQELELLGHTFVSHSDTEVILAAYREWGEQCLLRFNGMFAFVLIDRVARAVFAARDRFGVKPLYIWRSPDGLVALASEIKQFTVLPGWLPRVNGLRAYDFLNMGLLDHTDETLFQEVRQVRGGECINGTIDDLQRWFPIRRWYELAPRPFSGNSTVAATEFLALFTDAVRVRLRADVPVGSCLSGGLDSSSIVCTANQLLRCQGITSRQETFSACAKVKRYDEREYIDSVVGQTGVHAHYVYPDLNALFDTVDAITWHQDEPFGSTSIYAQWHVFRLAAAARVKVLLDGQGADELLAGYHGFFAPHFASLLIRRCWRELFWEIIWARRHHGMRTLDVAAHLAHALLPPWLSRPLGHVFGKSSTGKSWLNADRLSVDMSKIFSHRDFRTTSISKMSSDLLSASSVPMLLHWEDRNSMAHSTESRLPFLDFRLAEFLMGLPSEMKLSGATTKRVLREGMRGILPESIRMRMDKMGFVTPEEFWIRNEAPDLFRAELRKAIDCTHGIINGKALDHLERVISGKGEFSFLLWRMISFGRWMERFQVKLPT